LGRKLIQIICGLCLACTAAALSFSLALAHPVTPDDALADASLTPAAAPQGSPEAPWVEIKRAPNPAYVRLFWVHLIENDYYEIYRSPVPYFEPGDTRANRILDLSAGGYGSGSEIPVIDDGIDRYALDGVVGPVQVIGDVANNYFWAVQARAGDGVSGVINYVGEFDYALVKGG